MANVLSTKAIARLQRFRGRIEAGQAVVQQAQSVLQAYASQYEEMLRAACDEADVSMPPDGMAANINIDWKTGEVTWQPIQALQTNGHEPREPLFPFHQEAPD